MRIAPVLSVLALPALPIVLFTGCAPATPSDGGPDVPAAPGESDISSFDDASALDDFDVVLGDWQVADGAIRQAATFGDPEFPRLIRKELVFTDVDLSVRCQPESGVIDQVCGLMFHVVDSDNYLLTRSNVLENNIRLYHVVNGVRTQTFSADLTVTAELHDLAVTTSGASISVSWDGEEVLSGEDDTFTTGHVGLWTKADSVTLFDDLVATETAE